MQDGTKRILTIILKTAAIVLAVFLFLRIWKYIVPFIIAYFFASLIEPIVKFLERKLRVPRKIGSVISILIVLGAIIALFAFLIARLINEIRNVYLSLEINMESISGFFNNLIEQINGIYIQLPAEVTEIINTAAKDITSDLQSLLKNIVDVAQVSIQFALNLPQIFIFILVTILATYFMSSDKNTILRFLDGQMPSTWLKKTRGITNNVFTALFGWLRAQLIIMSITFTELAIGLLIIGIQNSLLIALIIALVDVLPILGAGTVLVPWSIINLLSGHTKLGLSTFLLYVIILFVRQLIEPKIVGKQIGVHPLLTLAGMYIGLRIFGVPGMFLGPLIVILIKYILEGIVKTDSFKGWVERTFKNKNRVVLVTDPVEEEEKMPQEKPIK